MDDRQLHRLLRDVDIPPADEKAKAGAISRATAEFVQVQKQKSTNSQGFSIFHRLTGAFNKKHLETRHE